jgi:hypothetical protein
MNQYHQQAEKFLNDFGIKCRIVKSNTKDANWQPSGDHYKITLWRKLANKNKRISFDFWGSLNDKEKGIALHPYSVLACISGEVYCSDSFADFCAEFGYDIDSISVKKTFKDCVKMSKKLQGFFNDKEIKALQEIQ